LGWISEEPAINQGSTITINGLVWNRQELLELLELFLSILGTACNDSSTIEKH